MGIEVASSFTRKAPVPLDDSFTVADNTARDAIVAGVRYQGMLVYVLASAKNFQLVGGIANVNWKEVVSSGGQLLAEIEADTTAGADQTITVPTKLIKRSTGALTSIAGFVAPISPLIFIWNNVTGGTVTVKNNAAAASAGNKILTGNGSDLSVTTDASLWFEYDFTSAIWRVIGGSGGGGGSTAVRAVTATGSIITTDGTLTVTLAANGTLTLPAASTGNIGKTFEFIRQDATANVCTIAALGSDLINGLATQELAPIQYATLRIRCLTASTWGIF